MTKYKQKCGYTREMYPPENKGNYIVKDISDEYFISYFDGKCWDAKNLVAWTEIPETDIDTPF